MPIARLARFLFVPTPQLSREEAMKVFKRDNFKCQYCGLDGLSSFENWLILTIDHVHPYARGGSRKMDNLLTACQPCNILKGKKVFVSREDAKEYVVAKRAEWSRRFQEEAKAAGAAGAR